MPPLIIKHRINTLAQVDELRPEFGAEIDVRADPTALGRIYLHHDAWAVGPTLEDWATACARLGLRGPIILNTKEDGLELQARRVLDERGLKNYFFLDTALPTMFNRVFQHNEHDFALRLSQYEPLVNYEHFIGKVDWIWADCIGNQVPDERVLGRLAQHFRICLVSPELVGQAPSRIEAFRPLSKHLAAVCTKYPDLWE